MLLEFRRHREVTNPAHIIGFLSQWKMYLDQIPPGEDARNFSGKKLDPTIFEKVLFVFLIPFQFFFFALQLLTFREFFTVDVFGTAWSII